MKERVMALDVGDKRIGIAVSDPLGITAQGLETYNRKGDEGQDAQYILQLKERYAPCRLLMGMPRNMNGTYGPQAEKVKSFGEVVEQVCGCQIEYFDERLTTAAAERILIDADMSRSKRRKVIDKMAAVVILQGYLDSGRF